MNGKSTILVTGATGTIGKALIRTLLEENYTVLAVVRNLEKSTQLFSNQVTHILYDGTTFSHNLSSLRPDIVIHLASHSTSSDEITSISTLINSNILFVSLLLDALKNIPLKLFVNSGSFSEYHNNDGVLNPTYLYSATKTASRFVIDYFSKAYSFAFINTILYSVYGAENRNKKIMDYMIDSLDAHPPIKMSDGNQVLDFIHIDDVVRFYMLIIKKQNEISPDYHEYHLGTGKGTSIKELAQTFKTISSKVPNIQWGAIAPRKRDTTIAIANTKNIFKDLDWESLIDLDTGVKMYLSHSKGFHA
ncbi:MAG: NAD-dependent epimerase/dehydratase family protein [Sulfuricurvum sp.]|nr:NAD-dependent epimerase/dehydratase family protein [Sulfuricurvum sp.]